MNTKDLIDTFKIPLIIVALVVIYHFAWAALDLPDGSDLVKLVDNLFDRYGMAIVLVASILEGVLLVGNYFPGGLVIFLGVITAGDDIGRVIAVVGAVSLGFLFSHVANYLLGKHGWYLVFMKFGLTDTMKRTKEGFERNAGRTMMMSFWFPNLAAVTSTVAGMTKYPFTKFFSRLVVVVVAWNIFWGTTVYVLGDKVLETSNQAVILGVVGALWFIAILFDKLIKHLISIK